MGIAWAVTEGADYDLTAPMAIALGGVGLAMAAFFAAHRDPVGIGRRALGVWFASLAVVVVIREVIRATALSRFNYDVGSYPYRVDWGSVAMFTVTTIVGVSIITYMVMVLFQSGIGVGERIPRGIDRLGRISTAMLGAWFVFFLLVCMRWWHCEETHEAVERGVEFGRRRDRVRRDDAPPGPDLPGRGRGAVARCDRLWLRDRWRSPRSDHARLVGWDRRGNRFRRVARRSAGCSGARRERSWWAGPRSTCPTRSDCVAPAPSAPSFAPSLAPLLAAAGLASVTVGLAVGWPFVALGLLAIVGSASRWSEPAPSEPARSDLAVAMQRPLGEAPADRGPVPERTAAVGLERLLSWAAGVTLAFALLAFIGGLVSDHESSFGIVVGLGAACAAFVASLRLGRLAVPCDERHRGFSHRAGTERGVRTTEMHVKPCDDWFEDVSAFVDGECDASISAAVEAHLETCARCAATAESMTMIRRRLLLTPVVAHPHLVAAVLGAAPEVGTAIPARSVGGSARRQWPVRGIVAGLAAAALLFVALLGGSAVGEHRRCGQGRRDGDGQARCVRCQRGADRGGRHDLVAKQQRGQPSPRGRDAGWRCLRRPRFGRSHRGHVRRARSLRLHLHHPLGHVG